MHYVMLLSNSLRWTIQIQHPRFHLNRFDLVITPRHDYYPLTPHAQQQLPWYLRRWVTPWEPPGRNVVGTVILWWLLMSLPKKDTFMVVIFELKCSTFCTILKVTDFTFLQVLTVGALHQADSAALRVAASDWHDELATLPKPLLVVNVGGPTGILFCIMGPITKLSRSILHISICLKP